VSRETQRYPYLGISSAIWDGMSGAHTAKAAFSKPKQNTKPSLDHPVSFSQSCHTNLLEAYFPPRICFMTKQTTTEMMKPERIKNVPSDSTIGKNLFPKATKIQQETVHAIYAQNICQFWIVVSGCRVEYMAISWRVITETRDATPTIHADTFHKPANHPQIRPWRPPVTEAQ
jgi:hypothetical protein